MKKICFITPSLHQGGLENSVTTMANEMAIRGHEIIIICAYNLPVFYKLHKSIKLIEPPYERKDFSKWVYYYKTIQFFKKKIKKNRPDVVISYGDFLNFISIIAVQRLRIPIYISDRSSPGLDFPFLVTKLRKFLYPKATGIIAQTARAKQQKEEMLKEYNNIRVIPNLLRTIKIYPEIKSEQIILAVARHYRVKGLDRLIQAFSKIEADDWNLIIAGNFGPQTDELKQMVEGLSIEKRVKFLGAVKEIDIVYQRAKIFVLPSRSEGFPNALIEAMANGLACISYDINAGPADVIENGKNGILVPDGDIPKLRDEIEYLIDHPEERDRLGRNAKKIKERLSLEKIGTEFYNFITAK